MDTPFLGAAYATRSPMLSSNTAINVYPELQPDKSGKVGGFYGTPGLEAVFTGEGEVRGLWVTGGPLTSGGYTLWAVIGNTVHKIDKSYNDIIVGTLPNETGRVSIVNNATQIVFAHQDGMHYATLTGTSLSKVANAPSGAIVTALDNYVVFTENVDSQFGITAIGDLSSIDPLDIAETEGWPDNCISTIADHREVWLFGTDTTEIWVDTGAEFFPFERAPGGFLEQGCAARLSPAKIDNSVFWLGRDRNGRAVVYRGNAYIPVRVSTHAIEYALNQGIVDDAVGMAYQEEGHDFYMLSCPTLNQTWVYDVATNLWHQRAYLELDGTLSRHRANCSAFFYEDHIVGDYANGNIYRMSLGVFTDDGRPIYRERAWQLQENPLQIENKRTRIDELELHALMGEPPEVITGSSSTTTVTSSDNWGGAFSAAFGQAFGGTTTRTTTSTSSSTKDNLVWLETSNDSGRTWRYKRYQDLGPTGQRQARARWRRLGSSRNLTLRVATDMAAQVSWVAAYVKGEVLAV